MSITEFSADPAAVTIPTYMWPSPRNHGRVWPRGPPPETRAQHNFNYEVAALLEHVCDSHFVLSAAIGRAMQHVSDRMEVEEVAGLASARQMEHGGMWLEPVKKVEVVGPAIPWWRFQ